MRSTLIVMAGYLASKPLALYFNKQYVEAAGVLSKLVSSERYKQRVDLHLAAFVRRLLVVAHKWRRLE